MKPYDTEQDKKEQVREMFDRIAPAYDRLNHTLSFQIDKLWRRHVVRIVRRMQPRRILDVATGTGDLALAMARRMRGVQVLGVDLSENMLAEARRKATACGLDERVVLSLGDAERLEVADASVDVVTVAFGVRNFGDLGAGLREIARVLKPGGKVVILEFSTPRNPLFRRVYGLYSHRLLPAIGGMISKDRKAYEYLPASVDEFPAPECFMAMMREAGFKDCRARSQSLVRTLLKYVLPVLFAALLSGCGASLARKVRIGEEVAVRQYGTVGLDLTFDVENASRRTLRLEEAELEFFTGAGSLGRAVLRGSVEVPGRSRGPVCSRWKFDFPDAAAGMVLRKRLEEGDYARLEVEVRMTLRAGAVRRRVSFERMPFSEFLNIFAEDRMRLG